ncbi:hypothetical protein [Actomonas aquatica]|uniref:Uncharacterized protein n=1 Tax=Actomonas aquatica TaxID=2866162 RepID=A0ABZ1CES2_9BACT|nr:hypothetical protein [Opitutus sp. WL0086]WRQ89912.1 hypothetical protein K1X11_010885 [Opitutus sp. WL0086]
MSVTPPAIRRLGLFLCLLTAGLAATAPRGNATEDTDTSPPNFHAFLRDVAQRATAVKVQVNRNFPREPTRFRIFRSGKAADIQMVADLLLACEEPPLADQDGAATVLLSPFPPPQFRYTITFESPDAPLLALWLIDRSVLQGLPEPWHHQARFAADDGAALMEFLYREHAFTPGAPRPDTSPSL